MDVSASPCLDERDVLAFVEGALASERRREILAHVDECEACRTLTAEIAREHSTEVDGDADDAEETPPPTRPRSDPKIDALVDERFRVLGLLGRGALGVVYRARDEKLGNEVALKVLRRGSGDAKWLAREVNAGRKITHPNVCRIYDGGTTGELDYLTMEIVEGDTLARVLAGGELPLARALEILDGVAAGLEAVHAQGIVHRDLKPANVIIERASGRVVLTDFGFATQHDAKQSRKLVGTPAFWAPEQARGEATTAASDVYSFGVLAYRLLAQRDFTLSDRDALDGVPRRLRHVVARCVAPWPDERFRDAAAVRAALRRAGAAKSSRRWLVIGLGAIALGAFWAMTRPPSPAEERAREVPSAEPARIAPSNEAHTAPVVPALPPSSQPSSNDSTSPVLSIATAPTRVHPSGVHPANPRPSAVAPAPSRPTPAPKSSEDDILYVK